jgi:hypothetical protein
MIYFVSSPFRISRSSCGDWSNLDLGLLQQSLENSVSEEDNGGHMIRQVAVFILLAGISSFGFAQTPEGPAAPAPPPEAAKDATYLICKNKAVVRTLRVSKKPNGGCMATYTKDGVDQIVGNSWTTERCAKVIGNIRENLEKANWKCKDISEARVSSSEG